MAPLDLLDAASLIVKTTPKSYAFLEPADNLLFRSLYDGLCRISGEKRGFSDLIREAQNAEAGGKNGETDQRVYGRAFRKLWNWYDSRYGGAEGQEKKKNGIDRRVKDAENGQEDLARFRTPFSYRSFLNYVRNGNPIVGADGCSFLLHTAVAFLLPPDAVDALLTFYGFMPLHIKNLFHVAIYVVLSSRQNDLHNPTDPFSEIEQCYLEELALVNREVDDASVPLDGETAAFASGSTRVIQQYVSRYEISKASMLSFIERHGPVFRRRHSRLIAEHKYLVDLFSELYMRKDIDELCDRNDEAGYTLYSFLREFCRSEKTNRDTFRNEIYWKVIKQGYQPTREFMILLWLFAFSFLFFPTVNEETWEGSVKNYAAVLPFETGDAYVFKPYAAEGRFHVLRYLSNEENRSAPLNGFFAAGEDAGISSFYGGDLISFLNQKLEDYSWRPLDARSPFDSIIKCFGNLDFEMELDEAGQRLLSVSYNGRDLDPRELPAVENVPYLLVLATELLKAVKSRQNERLPLPCKCCEIM